jgi:hypothetical protein
MLSARLVTLIEEHAEDLTRGVLADVRSNPRTPSYHHLPREELHKRAYDVYRNLGRWLGDKAEERIADSFGGLGRLRREEGIPLSEVAYALLLTKHHLHRYMRSAGLVDSALDLYQEKELNLLVEQFFDRAIYHTVRGYEGAASAGS